MEIRRPSSANLIMDTEQYSAGRVRRPHWPIAAAHPGRSLWLRPPDACRLQQLQARGRTPGYTLVYIKPSAAKAGGTGGPTRPLTCSYALDTRSCARSDETQKWDQAPNIPCASDYRAHVTAGHRVVRGGVEPPTFRFSGGRSYQLSYLTVPGLAARDERS